MIKNDVSTPLFGLCMVIVVVAVIKEHGPKLMLVFQHLAVRLFWILVIVAAAALTLYLLWKSANWIANKCKNTYRWFGFVEESTHQLINQYCDHDKILNRYASRLNSQKKSLKELSFLIEELNEFTGLKEHKIAQEKIKKAVEEMTPADFE